MRRCVSAGIRQRHTPSVSSTSAYIQKRHVVSRTSQIIWSNYFAPRSSPKLLSKIFGPHQVTSDEIAQKALETEAMRLPLQHQADMEALDRALRRLALRQQAGETVDDEEVAALEERFEEFKKRPEPDPEAYIKQMQEHWKRNPEEKAAYVKRIEERRAYLKKFAVQKGEHQIKEIREITSLENTATEGAPSRINTVEGFIADPTFDQMEFNWAARHGLLWETSRDEEEERFRNLPFPAKNARKIPITFVDSNYKVYKAIGYEDETLTLTALRNRVPIDAVCSDGVDIWPTIRKGYGPGCDTCKCRLDKDTFNKVEPPDNFELKVLFTAPNTTSSEWDRLGCMIRLTPELAGARIYIPPSVGIGRDFLQDPEDPTKVVPRMWNHADRQLDG